MSPEQVLGGVARSALRYLLARRHPARARDGPASVSPRRPGRDDGGDSARSADTGIARRGRGQRIRCGHPPHARQGLRRAASEHRRAAHGRRGAARARLVIDSRAVATAPAQPDERTPFVGRDAEAAELTRLLDRMLTGQGGLVLVGGEPGVGKTRLARELMAEARRARLPVSDRPLLRDGGRAAVRAVRRDDRAGRAAAAPGRARGDGRSRPGNRGDRAEPAPHLQRHPAAAGRAGRSAAAPDLQRLPRIRPARDAEVAGRDPAGRPALGRRADAPAAAASRAAPRLDAAAPRRHLPRRGARREAAVREDARIAAAPTAGDADRAPAAERVGRARAADRRWAGRRRRRG